ncbi:MAG: hypothetical protein NTY38_10365 [Acidobacteria bacterium]|nr:hypothetical protein [Acidobacteriota bacterium]
MESLTRVFPARFAAGEVKPSPAAAEGEAACFDHPSKRAAAACSQCGRFLCALCATDFHGEPWCPSCLDAGLRKKKVVELEGSRVLFDSIALMAATLPMLLIWTSVLGAPAALFVTFRYWNRPLGMVRKSRFRFVLAALIALAQLAVWAWLIGYFALAYKRPA